MILEEEKLDWKHEIERAGFRWCDNSKSSGMVFEYSIGSKISDGVRVRVAYSKDANYARAAVLSMSKPLSIVFASTSPVKKMQYGFLFRSNGILVNNSDIKGGIPEPQVEGVGDENERILVEDPLRRLSRFAARSQVYPVILEDTMLFIEYFNRDYYSAPMLPGPDTKRWWSALGDDGVLKLMANTTRRKAKLVCQLGVLTGDGKYHTFRSERTGSISHDKHLPHDWKKYLPYTSPFNFHSIFRPDGSDKTYSEMTPGEFRRFDYRSQCADLVSDFLKTNTIPPEGYQLSIFGIGE